MTSVICHPDYRDVTMPCRSGARLTLDVTMSHISIKMRRVVTADPGVTCPLSISDVAPGLYQSPDTGDPSRDQEKGKGEKERRRHKSIVKYGLPRLPRLAAHSLLIYN